MKKALQLFLLVAVLMTAFTTSADAQRKKKKKSSRTDDYFDDKGTFKDRLWYGADVSLGFAGLNGQSSFSAGIAPMVGYKLTENFSVGPRLEVLYTGARINNAPNPDVKFNATNYGLGAFTRLKILQMYFLQFEYQALSEDNPVLNAGGFPTYDPTTNSLITDRSTASHYYIGGGYSSSMGLIGFQATILWDLSEEFSSNNIPIVTRIGLNYKF